MLSEEVGAASGSGSGSSLVTANASDECCRGSSSEYGGGGSSCCVMERTDKDIPTGRHVTQKRECSNLSLPVLSYLPTSINLVTIIVIKSDV